MSPERPNTPNTVASFLSGLLGTEEQNVNTMGEEVSSGLLGMGLPDSDECFRLERDRALSVDVTRFQSQGEGGPAETA